VRYLALAGAALALGLLLWFRPSVAPSVAAAAPSGWSTEGSPSARSAGRHPVAGRALVYVAGEVARPGVYPVRPEARVRDAVALAGGMRAGADPVAVNLAAHVADGDEIVVPLRGAVVPRRAGGRRATGPRRRAKHARSHAVDVPPATPVDLNRADAETLATIPGIGPGLAERIVAFRAANGPFASPDELLDVAGFTDHRLDAVLPFVVAR
jgi:competence protein ComEA